MRAPLSPSALLALHLGFGAAVLVAAAWLFGAIAEDVVTHERITIVDIEIARWLRAHATPALTTPMLVLTSLHSTVAVSIYSAVVGLALVRRRQWRRLITVVVCLAGGMALNVLMKLAFQRARPVLDKPLLTLPDFSFPSGHVVGSTLMYGLVVAWVFTRTPHAGLRVAAVVAAASMVVLVAFTRTYLGVHFLSDVAAGFAEGVAWLALCLTSLSVFWRRTGWLAPAGAPATSGRADAVTPAHA